MAGRPRCLGCRNAFTPNYRNRTKTKHRQRFCAKPACRVASHATAQHRYRRSIREVVVDVGPRRCEAIFEGGARGLAAGSPAGSPERAAPVGESLVPTLASQIRRASAKIAAVLVAEMDDVIAAEAQRGSPSASP